MAIMTASGINTAESSTYLKSMLNELGNTGSDVSKILVEKTGKSFSDLMKEGKTLGDIMNILGDSVNNDATAFANLWSSQEAGTGALTILNAGTEKYNTTLEKITGTSDAVDKAYGKVTDTFKEKSKVVQESLKNVGIAAYNKFEEPLKGAMDSAQGAVSSLAKEMDSGKLGDSVDKVAEGFSDLITNAINLASKAIPLIVNGFAFVADNGKVLTTVLVGVSSAMIAMKTINMAKSVIEPMAQSFQTAQLSIKLFEMANTGATVSQAALNGTLTLGETVVGLLTGKVTLATAAQAAWNAVKALDPTMMIVLAVGALAAGIGALIVCMGDEENAHKEKMESIQNEIDSYAELKTQQQEQLSANLGEIENTQRLSNELGNLVDANGKVKDGYEARANFIVGELNSALGLNMQLVDDEIQGYSNLGTSIDNLIAKKRAEIILESQFPAYKEAVTNATNAQIEANKIETELSKARTEQKAIEAELEAKYGADWIAQAYMKKDALLRQWGDLSTDTTNKETEYNKQNELVKGYYEDITAYETNATLLASENAEAYKLIQTDVGAKKAETVQGQIAQIELEKEAELKHLEFLKGELATATAEEQKRALQAQIGSSQSMIKTKEEEIKGLTSTVVNKGKEYSGEVKKLAIKSLEEFDGDTKKYFGVSQEKFDNVVKGLKSKDKDVKDEATKAAKEMLKGVKSKDDQFSKAGADVLEGVIRGSNSKVGNLYSTMADYGASMLDSFKKSLGIKSPSREFAKLSKFIPEGISKGIEDNEKGAIDSVSSLSDSMLSIFDNIDLDGIIKGVQDQVMKEQLVMVHEARINTQGELSKISVQNSMIDKVFKAALDGKIEVHVDLDGREVGIGLAPIIAEELAFK